MAHSTSYRTSFQRASMLSLPNKIATNSYLFPYNVRHKEAAKHGPALGVIPVFIPLQPSPSILLVFYHTNGLPNDELMLEPMFSLSSSIVWLEAMVSVSSLSLLTWK